MDAYKMICDNCDMFYIGQTGRAFVDRLKEHLPKSNLKSNYANHLMTYNHKYSDSESNCKPLRMCYKGRHMDAAEEFEIYRPFRNKSSNVLNDQLGFKWHDCTIQYWAR